MQVLPKWVLTNKFPAIHDFESLTVIEQTARIYGAMNSMIEEYNAFADNVNKNIKEFQTASEADREQFEIAMRQEFQDFIDVIDLKIKAMENDIFSVTNDVKGFARELMNEAFENGTITIEERYDTETESLSFVIGGGV